MSIITELQFDSANIDTKSSLKGVWEQNSTVIKTNILKFNSHPVMSSSNDKPIEAHAVAVEPEGTIAQAPIRVEATAAPDIGICRRCRQQFVRRPGVNDGQAQYYRCEECEGKRLEDMFYGSCAMS